MNNCNGTSIKDYVYLYGGADTTSSGLGYDVVYGGDGNDTLKGQSGNDELYGEGGNDHIWDGPGTDIGNGGTGSDTLHQCSNDGAADTFTNFETVVQVTC